MTFIFISLLTQHALTQLANLSSCIGEALIIGSEKLFRNFKDLFDVILIGFQAVLVEAESPVETLYKVLANGSFISLEGW